MVDVDVFQELNNLTIQMSKHGRFTQDQEIEIIKQMTLYMHCCELMLSLIREQNLHVEKILDIIKAV